ncbi:MAG: hypothetical protein AAGD14_10725 [Planctomycetota bacterium]
MRSLVTLALLLAACATPEGATQGEQRAQTLAMRDESIAQLRKRYPNSHALLDDAYGTAVFTNISMTIFFAGGGGGYGVATRASDGATTFMTMRTGSAGLGLGGREYRLIAIFRTQAAYEKFIAGGSGFGGEAEVSSGEGDAPSGGTATGGAPDVRIYQLTTDGTEMKATLTSAKFEVGG